MSATDNRATDNQPAEDLADSIEVADRDQWENDPAQREMTEGERLAEEGHYAPQERTPQEKASLLFGGVFLLLGAACWLVFF